MAPIEIKIPKEIRNYHENIFFGLNTRQFVCSLLALGAAPFAACGFFSYHGMTAEQLLWAWIKSEILMPRRLVFKSDCLYYQVIQPAIAEGCKRKRRPKKRTDKAKETQTDKTKPKRRNHMTEHNPKANQNQDNPAAPEARH